MRLRDDIFFLECGFPELLPFINSQNEKGRVLRLNRNIKSNLYPLTKAFLQNHYLTTDYSNLKNTAQNVDCAADVYSYFVQSYGRVNGSTSGQSWASGAGSSGLNPFGLINANLGFGPGDIPLWVWLLLFGGAYLYFKEK